MWGWSFCPGARRMWSILSFVYRSYIYSVFAQETGVQSQVKSYQRLKKWYLIPACLTLSIMRYASRVKWSNPGKGIAPSPTPWCSSYWKGSLRVTFNNSHQLYFMYKQDLLLDYLKGLISHKSKPTKRECWFAIKQRNQTKPEMFSTLWESNLLWLGGLTC